MNDLDKLTSNEKNELEDAISSGIGITRTCAKSHVDWFNIRLDSGKRCCGKYKWDTEGYIKLSVFGGKR